MRFGISGNDMWKQLLRNGVLLHDPQVVKSMRRQQRELSKQADTAAATSASFSAAAGLGREAIAELSPEAVGAASAAHNSRIAAARAMREVHKAELAVEVATAEQVPPHIVYADMATVHLGFM